jgi:hypothetical protein
MEIKKSSFVIGACLREIKGKICEKMYESVNNVRKFYYEKITIFWWLIIIFCFLISNMGNSPKGNFCCLSFFSENF